MRAFRDRYRIPVTDEQLDDAPFYRPPEDSPEIRYLHERRKALGGYLPARRRELAAARDPRSRDLPAHPGRVEGPGDVDHDVLRASPHVPDTRREDRQSHRADRSRRGPDLRHGGTVPHAGHLLVDRAALRARRRRPGHVLPRGREGPDPRGGHHRGRRDLRRGSLRRPPTRTSARR